MKCEWRCKRMYYRCCSQDLLVGFTSGGESERLALARTSSLKPLKDRIGTTQIRLKVRSMKITLDSWNRCYLS